MTIFSFLYLLIIGPLELFFETVFSVANNHVSNPGFAIVVLSIVINILVLPMYNRTEKIQAEQRDLESKIAPGVKHIKKSFNGDERMFVLQTYYRQNNYSPIMSLRSAMSLLLQIPFFIAAYNMLSSLKSLQGATLGPIADLSKPDALIVIGSLTLNALPIIMTLINIISGMIYTKGHPLKEKLQIYGMALVFLVLLYNSPSGLVFYWTFNNVFSLGKNVVLWVISKFSKVAPSDKSNKKNDNKDSNKLSDLKIFTSNFVMSSIVSALLIGLLIPSVTIKASPLEFFVPGTYGNSIVYIWYSFATAVGVFVLWFGVFYYIASPTAKKVFSVIMSLLTVVFLYDYYCGPGHTYALDTTFMYPLVMGIFYEADAIRNFVISYLLIVALLVILYYYKKQIIYYAMTVIAIALVVLSVINIHSINEAYKKFHVPETANNATLALSKTENNVVVIMLDRALGFVVDDIFEARPELCEQFDGFTYYPNVVSFGGHTNIASPALFGGYEYTPDRINERFDDSLETKQNEALSVLPVMFSNEGYNVTVIDPPYAGYMEISDTTIYDEYENINCYVSGSSFVENREEVDGRLEHIRERNIFCYSLMKVAPFFVQNFIYDNGEYNEPGIELGLVHKIVSSSLAIGYDYMSLCDYSYLNSLSNITDVTDQNQGGFLMLTNNFTHDSMLLSQPDFTLDYFVDNRDVDRVDNAFAEETDLELFFDENMGAMVLLGQWFDFLREEGVYDNTRIIIVSDHGYDIYLDDGNMIPDSFETIDSYNPVFMVKDFNSTGFTVSDEFRTNADMPFFAVNNLLDSTVNPFTGNNLYDVNSFGGDIVISASHTFNTNSNHDNLLPEEQMIIVHNRSMDPADWELVTEASLSN